ncbi:MAG: zinc carboxypeptidase, partial [Chitinophagaceae bacterium]|nr:zinc carboxypeptidase [Chitinophagaceae bacterium]
EWFHRWKPNILTDHHEQGSSATFFFQPGVPSRVNPITPLKNQELTAKLGKFHAAYLDKIGSLYFTKESYDDFYYGKGSTYPDVNGAIGILFEQASSRGHLQETDNGLLTFPFTIRNQFTTTLSTLEGARQLRTEFLQWQKDFYTTALKEAAASPVKGYVFGSQTDKTKSAIFTEMLLRHQIQVYEPGKATAINGTQFTPGDAYYVPTDQPQFRLIQAIFTKTLEYKDSLFYDITAWTLPLAYGLSYAEANATQAATLTGGKRILQPRAMTGTLTGKSEYAYLFDWNEFYAPRALYELQQAGILTKVATTSFEVMVAGATRKFQPGSIMVPVSLQSMDSEKLFTLLKGIASSNGIEILPVTTGASVTGSDLGSRNFAVTQKPRIAMIVGTGANATDAGEVWHLLDQRFNMPATHLEQGLFNQADLTKYNTLIMVGGRYTTIDKEKLRQWIEAGGTLILTEESINWAQQAGISTVGFRRTRPATDSATVIPYADLGQVRGAQQMSGAIFSADFDPTHPLAYGYPGKTVSLFKANNVFLEIPPNRNAAPFQYGKAPLQSGWLSQQNYAAMKNSAAVVVNAVGSGRVINIADNPNFRAFWLGGTKLMMNAIFFG